MSSLSHRVSVEDLEPRAMLSASLSAKGTLVVVGGAGADAIIVRRDPKRSSKILVLVNGAGQKFNTTAVKRIEVYGRGGADHLRLDDSFGVVSGRGTTVYGGDGNDSLFGGLAGVTLDGGRDQDELRGSTKNDVIRGNDGRDTIFAGRGSDVVLGGGGDDVIRGAQGDDILYGDAGDDTILGEDGNDTLGGDGEDRLQLKGFSAPVTVTGDDSLDGGNGNDWITGGNESATLHTQNNGEDTITGGPGNDVLDARSWDTDSDNPDDIITDRAAGDIVPMENHTRQATAGEVAQGEAAYAVHMHAEVILMVMHNGKLRRVAMTGGIGDFVSPTLANTSPRIHTHAEEEGILHMHDLDPHTFTLGEFFRGWGVTIGRTHLGRYVAGNGHTLTFSVRHGDGTTEQIADPYNYVIQGDHDFAQADQITITYV